MSEDSIRYEVDGSVAVITIDRFEEARHAISIPVGIELYRSLRRFEADDDLSVAVLTGAGGVFSAGFDLTWYASVRRGETDGPSDAPPDAHSMGPTRIILDKPVIAAVEDYAVAGGLELACWCDMRVADEIDLAMAVYEHDPVAHDQGVAGFEAGVGRHERLADGRSLADL